MSNKHLARYLTSLIIREMQIEIMRYPFISIVTAKIKKADKTQVLPKFELLYIDGGIYKLV